MSEPDFYLGETWFIPGQALDADGNPIRLLGATVEFRLSTSAGKVLDLSLGNGIEIEDVEKGEYVIQVSPENQAGWNTKIKGYTGTVRITLGNGTVMYQGPRYFNIGIPSFRKWA